MKAATESDILRGCLDLLALHRVFAWRSNQAAVPLPGGGFRKFRGMKGVADVLGCLDDGRLLACEIKKPGGRLTADQKAFLDNVRRRGGLALCVRSVGELEEALRKEGVIG
jgi:hypothetical protein